MKSLQVPQMRERAKEDRWEHAQRRWVQLKICASSSTLCPTRWWSSTSWFCGYFLMKDLSTLSWSTFLVVQELHLLGSHNTKKITHESGHTRQHSVSCSVSSWSFPRRRHDMARLKCEIIQCRREYKYKSIIYRPPLRGIFMLLLNHSSTSLEMLPPRLRSCNAPLYPFTPNFSTC